MAPSCLGPLYPLKLVWLAGNMQRYRCRLLSVPATPSALKGNYSYAVRVKKKKKKNKRKKNAAVFGVDYSAHSVALLQSTDRR